MPNIQKNKTRIYTDLNMFFGVHPSTRDILVRTNEEAVKSSLKHLINTNFYERLFHPEIGCQVYSMLFEPYTPITTQIMRTTIENVVKKYEPRVVLVDVRLSGDMDKHEVNITLEYFIKNINTPTPFILTTFLKRVR